MGFADLFRAEQKPEVKFEVYVPPEMQQGMTAAGTIAPRISRAQALQVPAVMRARNLIAGVPSRLPVRVCDKDHKETDPTNFLPQIDPDIPNVVTFAETYEDLLFEGVSWWKITAFGYRQFPMNAQHIGVDRVHVTNNVFPINGSYPPQTPGQVYIDGQPVRDDQVIRFDSPNPPLLVHAAKAIRTCLNLDTTASNYAENPVPLGAFRPKEGIKPKEDKESIRALLDEWESARKHRVWAYIGAAWDMEEFQFNAEQIQLAEQRQHAVLEIARACGIDPEDLGVSTTSRTYQNSEQRRQDFIDFTLAPYVAAVEQRLSMNDVLPRGYYAKVNFDAFLRADTKTRMETYKIGEDVGAYTEEEIRALEDRPPLPKKAVPAPQPQEVIPNGVMQ